MYVYQPIQIVWEYDSLSYVFQYHMENLSKMCLTIQKYTNNSQWSLTNQKYRNDDDDDDNKEGDRNENNDDIDDNNNNDADIKQ